jgi:hypothetical protein
MADIHDNCEGTGVVTSLTGTAADVPGLEVSPRDLLERSLLQLGISRQPLKRRVLAFEILEPLGVLGSNA